MTKKNISLVGVLFMLMTTIFVITGCPQTNKPSTPTPTPAPAPTPAPNPTPTPEPKPTNGDIKGVWEVTEYYGETFPREKTDGTKTQYYLYFKKSGDVINAERRTGRENGVPIDTLYKLEKREALIESYELLDEDGKIKVTGHGEIKRGTYTVTGSSLSIPALQLKCKKVSSPTGAEIEAAPEKIN